MTESYRWRPVDPATIDAGWWSRWDSLNVDGCAGNPLLDAAFASNTLAFFGDGQVQGWACEDSRGDVAMALVRRTSKLTWDVFQPSQAPVPLIVFRRDIQRPVDLLAALMRRVGILPLRLRVTRLDLTCFLRIDDALGERQVELVGQGTTFAVSSGSTFQDYWAARPRGLQSNLRRYFRRLDGEGLTWRLQRTRVQEEMPLAVATYGDVESAGWKGAEGTAIHAGNQQGRFYARLLKDFAERGDAFVYFLWIGEELAAARLVIAGRGTAVMLKTAFSEKLARFAPGRLLLYLALQDLAAIPAIRRVEFYTNANKDALEWASDQRQMYAFTLYRSAAVRKAVDALNSVRLRLRRATEEPSKSAETAAGH